MNGRKPKQLHWVGSSRDDLKAFEDEVRRHIGYALYQAQVGLKHRDVKPLAGIGPGILEVVSRYDKDTYRAVYTVRFAKAVYVLHAFQKKSKRRIATPQRDIELVRERLKAAERHHQLTYGGTGKR